MKRFIAVIAVLAVVALTAVAGAPAVTTGTTPAPAPAEKKTDKPMGILKLATGSGGIEAFGTGSFGTRSSTKPSKPKMTTAPVGTK